MPRSPFLLSRVVGLAAAIAIMSGAACYNPTISPNFRCNNAYVVGAGDCPQGYSCSAQGICLPGPPRDAGVDVSSPGRDVSRMDAMEAPSPDVTPVDTAPDVQCINVP